MTPETRTIQEALILPFTIQSLIFGPKNKTHTSLLINYKTVEMKNPLRAQLLVEVLKSEDDKEGF